MGLKTTREKTEVSWSGEFFVSHSLAHVNREMTLALLGDAAFTGRHDLCLEEAGVRAFDPTGDARLAPLAARAVPCRNLKAIVRHIWPPDFRAPASGQVILCQP